MDDGCKLLYFFRGSEAEYPPPFIRLLEARGWQIDPVGVPGEASAYGVIDVLRRRRDFASYDIIAANEYFLTWAVCLGLTGIRRKPKVAAISFNQSRKLLLTGLKPVDRLLNRVWRAVSMFLVHSKAEALLFGKLHNIPADKFVFSHWGYDLPPREDHDLSLPSVPYVSMIGRNNRDIATFCAAVEKAGVEGVIVTAGYMLDRYQGDIPASVKILTDRPMEECLATIEGSFAHLLLVVDGERGAGHISAVIAMLLGIPQIYSDVGPLQDYLEDGVNGLAVGVGDVDGVAKAIGIFRDDAALAKQMGGNGRTFAEETLPLPAASKRAADAFSALASAPVSRSK